MALWRVAHRSSLVRLVFAALAVALVAFLVVPQASAQVDDGDPKEDPKPELCPDGKPPDETGSCATQDPPPRCPDGSEPKEGQCPPTTTTTNPCPDGEDFCEQIRACPIDTPLPPGSTCQLESSAPPTTEPPAVDPAPTPNTDGASVLGRVIEPEPVAAPSPAPAPAPAPGAPAPSEDLARTGAMEGWLTALGSVLVALGAVLVRVARRRAGFVTT